MNILGTYPGFIIIEKPAGISVHREEGDKYARQDGILPQLRQQLNIEQLHIVHRLDRVTSGIMIIATDQSAASNLGRMFQNREIEKYYLAISDKKPKKKQGMIKGDMEKSRGGSWKLIRSQKNPAITQFFSLSIGTNQRLFIIKPSTGKTHQIRVALKSIGAPILGDTLYGPKQTTADRTYLHAYALRFQWQGETLEIICPPEEGGLFENLSHHISKSESKTAIDYLTPWTLSWPEK